MPRDSARNTQMHFVVEMLRINITATRLELGATSLSNSIRLAAHFIREKRDPGEIRTWPGQRHGNSRAHWAIADATDD